MNKTIIICGTLFIFVGITATYLAYRQETCTEYHDRILAEAKAAVDKGQTIYQVVDGDKFNCVNQPKPTLIYFPTPTNDTRYNKLP